MKIKSFKCTCGHDDFFFADKGNQTGIYCSTCGKWLKWADKDEKNLQLKSQSVAEILDKIRAEIEEVYNDRPCSYNHTQRRELFCKVIEIIDKCKADSEVKPNE